MLQVAHPNISSALERVSLHLVYTGMYVWDSDFGVKLYLSFCALNANAKSQTRKSMKIKVICTVFNFLN